MNDYQRETEFLRQCIRYDDTVEHHKLEERINELQRDERCVRRAVWLMALFAALALVSLGYGGVFLADFPLNLSKLTEQLIIKVPCALGAGSLICLGAFLSLGAIYRKELDQRREECRRLAMKLLESHLGKPPIMPSLGIIKERETIVNRSEGVVSAPEIAELPQARRRSQSFS